MPRAKGKFFFLVAFTFSPAYAPSQYEEIYRCLDAHVGRISVGRRYSRTAEGEIHKEPQVVSRLVKYFLQLD